MLEETRKYAEEVYVDKEELAQRLDLTGVVLDAVWKQVEDYRTLLCRSLYFDDLHVNIIMTKALCARLQQTTELLYRCSLWRLLSMAARKSVLFAGSYPHRLYKVGGPLALAPPPYGLVTSLGQEEEPLLLCVSFLSVFTGESTYLNCLLVHKRCHTPFVLVMEGQPNRTVAGDLGIRSLVLLDGIRLQIS